MGGGFVQDFRYARLLMPDSGSMAGKVIFSWFGLELLWYQAQLHQAQLDLAAQKHEVTTLTTQLQQSQAQIANEQEQVKTLQTELQAHPGNDVIANRLSAIGLETRQAQDLLTQVQGLVTQPL
jgi:multidrug resistance efflux pump